MVKNPFKSLILLLFIAVSFTVYQPNTYGFAKSSTQQTSVTKKDTHKLVKYKSRKIIPTIILGFLTFILVFLVFFVRFRVSEEIKKRSNQAKYKGKKK